MSLLSQKGSYKNKRVKKQVFTVALRALLNRILKEEEDLQELKVFYFLKLYSSTIQKKHRKISLRCRWELGVVV